jgi:hypothetical protein
MGNKLLPTDFKVEIDSMPRFYLRDGIYVLENVDSFGQDFMPEDRMFFDKNGEPELIDYITATLGMSGMIYSWVDDPLDGRKLNIDTNHFFQPETINIRFSVSWTDSYYDLQAFKLFLFKDNTLLGIDNYYNDVLIIEQTKFPSGDYLAILDSSDFPEDIHLYNFYIRYIYGYGVG